MKKIILIIIASMLVAAGAFYGGMRYGQSKLLQGLNQGQQRFFGSSTSTTGTLNGRSGNRTGTGFIAGQIITKDENGITLKLQDGGSKIIFFSDFTEISKFVSGSTSDLGVGTNITVNGTTNPDGSITAKSIQIRPEGIIPPR